MMQGTYYKEWSRMLGREMEFKVYGTAGVPVLALPARGGRFYDWENNGMPEAVASLLSSGKLQLFTADGIDAESLLAGDAAPRRRAEMQEKYFNYLSTELASRIRELNQTEKGQLIWCVGVDTGACQAVWLSSSSRRPMASPESSSLQERSVSSARARSMTSAGAMTWQMPGKCTTGKVCITPPTGRESCSMRSGRGMATVPMKQPSIRVMRQATGCGAPETGRVRARSAPTGSSRCSQAAMDMVALPQNSPPIICRRGFPAASPSAKPTCSASFSRRRSSAATRGCTSLGTGVVTRRVIFFVGSMTV